MARQIWWWSWAIRESCLRSKSNARHFSDFFQTFSSIFEIFNTRECRFDLMSTVLHDKEEWKRGRADQLWRYIDKIKKESGPSQIARCSEVMIGMLRNSTDIEHRYFSLKMWDIFQSKKFDCGHFTTISFLTNFHQTISHGEGCTKRESTANGKAKLKCSIFSIRFP